MVRRFVAVWPSAQARAKAARVRLVLTDSDGVLTDGGVYYSARGEELRRFSVRDGMGVERLRAAGIETVIVTREAAPAVEHRGSKLGIEVLTRVADKLEAVTGLIARHELTWAEVAYIGDDVNDLAVMRRAGFSACPADAEPQVLNAADIVCRRMGGHGAFREFAEIILASRLTDADSFRATQGERHVVAARAASPLDPARPPGSV
ncbi:MAG TPA: HAD hydrolase family protein [Gemmatimonadales bacterium]|jgi:3-deoxy-D-manno-octulosonate 8-phosphate phosphatase (KDO 8-P phosphatase)